MVVLETFFEVALFKVKRQFNNEWLYRVMNKIFQNPATVTVDKPINI